MKISFFFPVYNDEGSIEKLALKSDSVLKKYCDDYEIIIVDDASPDRSGEIADKLADRNNKIRVIHHPENKGYAQAVMTGVQNSKFNWILFTDGDMQFDLSELGEFLKHVSEADIIVGYRIKRADSWQRIVFSFFYNKIANLFFGIGLRDINCAFKLMKKHIFEGVTLSLDYKEAFFLIEVFYKAKRKGCKIKQIPVRHYPRIYGHSQCFSNRMLKRYVLYTILGFFHCRVLRTWQS